MEFLIDRMHFTILDKKLDRLMNFITGLGKTLELGLVTMMIRNQLTIITDSITLSK